MTARVDIESVGKEISELRDYAVRSRVAAQAIEHVAGEPHLGDLVRELVLGQAADIVEWQTRVLALVGSDEVGAPRP